MGEKKETHSKEGIRAEMSDAKLAMRVCGFIGGIFLLLAIGYTWGALSIDTAKEALGLLPFLWIITLGLAYGAWKYYQRYKKWKSLL